MTAYSMIAAKMLRMQVTTNVSIALRLVEDEEGELALLVTKLTCTSIILILILLCCIKGVDDDKEENDK